MGLPGPLSAGLQSYLQTELLADLADTVLKITNQGVKIDTEYAHGHEMVALNGS
jgi:hypothetical protein